MFKRCLSVVALLAAQSIATLPVYGQNGHSSELDQFIEAIDVHDTSLNPRRAALDEPGSQRPWWRDISDEALDREAQWTRNQLDLLRTNFDLEKLDAKEQFRYRVVEDELELRLERDKWRDHSYPLNQIVGLHLQVAGTLTKNHPINSAADVETYLERVELVDDLFTVQVERMQVRNSKGLYGPKDVYPRLLEGARNLSSGYPLDKSSKQNPNPVWENFEAKIAALDVSNKDKKAFLKRGKKAFTGPFKAGYQKLIAQLENEMNTTPMDGGVWQMPQGDAYYEFLIRQFTTTDMKPAEIHQLGLDEVARIHKEMIAIKDKVGFEGDLPAFFEFLKTDPQFYLPNTDAGRAEYLARAEAALDKMKANVTKVFYKAPPIDVVVRRIEAYREKSSAGALYESGSLEESRPGAALIKLDDMSSVPLFDMEALLYHEGIPGHHMQISSIMTDPDLPGLFKKSAWYSNSAFVEGWALYAETLAKEMGAYQDPYSEFGRLAGELWRACRLVVDSGLHYKRWDRQTAVDYLNDNTASSEEANYRAVDRYLAVPGQATSFKVGMIRFEEKRDEAKEALGDKFDIRGYHQAVLENGYVPLWAMSDWVDHWIAETKAK